MGGPTSDPVFASRNLYSGDFFVVTRADLLTKPRAPSSPKIVEKTFEMLWHQKSLEAIRIERELELFREPVRMKQQEAKEEVLEILFSEDLPEESWKDVDMKQDHCFMYNVDEYKKGNGIILLKAIYTKKEQ